MFTTRALLCFALMFMVTVPAQTKHVSKTSTHKILDIIHRLLNVAGHGVRHHDGRFVAFDVGLTRDFRGRKTPDKVMYDKINVNIGQAYHNGQFVCPVDGVYEFSWTSLGIAGKQAHTFIYVNDKRKRYSYNVDNTGKLYLLTTTSFISHLKKGDRVWIATLNGNILNSSGNQHSYFQGKLLHVG